MNIAEHSRHSDQRDGRLTTPTTVNLNPLLEVEILRLDRYDLIKGQDCTNPPVLHINGQTLPGERLTWSYGIQELAPESGHLVVPVIGDTYVSNGSQPPYSVETNEGLLLPRHPGSPFRVETERCRPGRKFVVVDFRLPKRRHHAAIMRYSQ